MDWFTLTIIATILYGVQNFLFKVSAERKYNSAWVLFSQAITVSALAAIAFGIRGGEVENWTFILWFALLSAALYLAVTFLKLEALKHIDTNVHFPITRFKIATIAIASFIIFNESLTFIQILGVLLAMVAVLLVVNTKDHKPASDKNVKLGLTLTFLALAVTTAGFIVIKIAALEANKLAFIAISAGYGILLSFAMRNRLNLSDTNQDHRSALILGISVGVINFVGYFLLLSALELGPLSIIATIQALMFIVTIVLAAIFFKERFTLRKSVAVAFTIIAVFLLK